MPITAISFRNPEDIHLLRGNQVDLSTMIQVEGVPVGAVTHRYKPLFKAAEAAGIHTGFNITINATSGIVAAMNAVPAQEISNFLVEVEATDAGDANKQNAYIRIHIHRSVVRAWLTPETLTVRKPESGIDTDSSFGLRIEFDDRVVANLKSYEGVSWGPASNVEPNDGLLKVQAGDSPASAAVTVTATLPARLGGGNATGNLKFANKWSDDTRIKTNIVVGGGWPGIINPQVVPNILFLADGFKSTDSAKFESIVDSFVQLMKTSKIVSPFNVLATSMNFWKAFIPSRERGISVLCEVYTKTSNGKTKAYPVPNAKKAAAAGDWTVENLLYAVGLPVETDSPLAIPTLRVRWNTMFENIPGVAQLKDGVIKEWQAMSNRCFIEEPDSALGLAYGTYPHASGESDTRLIHFHVRRMSRSRLDNVTRRLSDLEHNVDIQGIWDDENDGSSQKYVFVLSSAKWDRGVNHGRGYIAMNTEDRKFFPVEAVAGKKSVKNLEEAEISASLSKGRMIRGVHELGHSFNLGDEYQGEGDVFPNSEDVDSFYANLQKHDDLLIGGDISGDKIKWRWPRIKKAGIIDGAITENGGKFTIPLQLGHANWFQKGTTVHLRFRKFPEILLATTPVSPAFNVDKLNDANSVTIIPVVPGTVTLAQLNSDFPPGSIIFEPVLAPESVRSAAYPYAELVAKNIKDHINTRKRALNIPTSAANLCASDQHRTQEPVNIDGVDLPFCFKDKPRIVGLFSGGGTYNCGIYHPTGSCIMRNSNEDGKEFCAVCRYILVDTIDPQKHWYIDRDYDKIYAQP